MSHAGFIIYVRVVDYLNIVVYCSIILVDLKVDLNVITSKPIQTTPLAKKHFGGSVLLSTMGTLDIR